MMDLDLSRKFAIELISYACGRYTGGRDENDAVYQSVTEARDVGAQQRSYSSCGDLAHWLLYRMGSRAKFINRKEHLGWQSGLNVSKLAYSSLSEDAKETDIYQAGDILIIWSKPDATDAHVMVVLEHQGSRLLCGEYGQPGGKVREHQLARPLLVGTRKIHRVLRFAKVLDDGELRGELQEPDYTALPLAQAYLVDFAPKPPAAPPSS